MANILCLGIGLDACLLPTRFENVSIIQTVDFFYPLIDDPYTMGRIACANVVSDLYAFGVYQIDKIQMILSICNQFSEHEVEVIKPLIIKGFQDAAMSAGSFAVLQNATINPWCIIGGIATSVCSEKDYINPMNAQIGDVLILTKPLGVQIACNVNRWKENRKKWEQVSKTITQEEASELYETAVRNMCCLNKNAAYLMHKYKAHAATDITGFGIFGHAENLVKFQKEDLKFVIHSLPFIKNALSAADAVNGKNKLLSGRAPETSGGLLICMPNENAKNFCQKWKKFTRRKLGLLDMLKQVQE
ncbi:hypothetical protein FQR65_LT10154 [Abscondita terminalis]|nr:hypothetical protein FQR65_LT10154 [Abscondita terminalis]